MFLVLLLAGCTFAISSSALLSRLGNEKAELAVVDVRTGFEFSKSHLPGAVNISLLVLPFLLAAVSLKDKGDPVVVYCSHGPRAGLAGFITDWLDLKMFSICGAIWRAGDRTGC
jgi:3-mercaptopyruvate sulfurtransferase SseA